MMMLGQLRQSFANAHRSYNAIMEYAVLDAYRPAAAASATKHVPLAFMLQCMQTATTQALKMHAE